MARARRYCKRALADANFQGNLEANVQLTLDPDDRQAILKADQSIERATQELSNSIASLIASNSGLIEGALGIAERISTNLTDLVKNDFFLGDFLYGPSPPTIDALSGGQTRAVGPAIPEGFVPGGATPATGGRQLTLETPAAAAAVGDAVAEAIAPTFAALAGTIQSRNNRGPVGGLLGQSGPDPFFDNRLVREGTGGTFDDLEVGGGGQVQVLFASMADDLAGIHAGIYEFLPEVANNTLFALSAGADFAANPNIVSLVRFGGATVRLLGGLLRQSEPDPFLPEGTDVSEFRSAPFGRVDPNAADTVVPELDTEELGFYGLGLEQILELIDPELVQRFQALQAQATEAWKDITLSTDDNQERLRLFEQFMTGEFQQAWDSFQVDALAAWDANREGLMLSEEQTRRLDEYLRGPFISTIDAFEASFIASWQAIEESAGSFEERTRQIGALLGEEVPFLAALLEAGLTGLWQAALAGVDLFGQGVGKANVQITTLEEAVAALEAGIITMGEFAALVNSEMLTDSGLTQEGITTVEEAFAALEAGIITMGEFAALVNNEMLTDSGLTQGGITTLEEAFAALEAGIITMGEFAALVNSGMLEGSEQVQGGITTLEEAYAALEAGIITAGEFAALVNSEMLTDSGLTQGGITTLEEAFAALEAGIITAGEFAALVNSEMLTDSGLTREGITTVEEAYAALEAGIITAGKFAEIVGALVVESAGSMSAAATAAAASFLGVRFQLQGIRAVLLAIPTQRTITITTVQRTVYESVGNPQRSNADIEVPEQAGTLGATGAASAALERRLIELEQEQTLGQAGPTPNRLIELEQEQTLGRGFQFGGSFIADQPSFFLAGEAGPERVQITPENAQAPEGGGSVQVVINYYAQADDDYQFEDRVVRAVREATGRNADVVQAGGVFSEGDR